MGIVSKIKEKVKSGYNRADAYLGGNLPGGVPSGTGLTKYNAPTSIGGYGGSPNNVPNSSSSPSTSTTRTYSGSSGGGRSSGSTTAQQNAAALNSGTAITGGSGGIMQTGTELKPTETKGSSFSGGLSGQVKTAPVKSISAAGELSSKAGTYRTSYWEATKSAIKDVGTDIGIAFGGQRGNYVNPFERFSSAGEEKSEKTAFYKPEFGTKQTKGVDMTSGRLIETGAYTPITFLEVQKETEFKRNVKIQQSSNKFGGMVTEKTTETELADINKEYRAEQNKIYSELPDVQGFTTRSGQGLVTAIPAVLETGALIGASTLGGPVGLGVASAYTFGQGFKQTVTAENNLDRALGLTTIGLSGLGIKGSLLGIERQIVSGELTSLSKQSIKFKQIQVQQGDKSIVGFEAFQKQGGLTRQISGRGVAFKEGDNIFVIPKGNVKIKTTGSLGWNIYGPTETNIFAEQAGTFGSKSAFKQIDDFTFSVGKSTFIPKYSTTSIYGLDTAKRKVTRFTTNFKLGGEQVNSFSFLSSKQAPADVYGNDRFFSAGFGIKGGKIIKPAQFGTTTILSGENLPKFGGGLADDFTKGFGSSGGGTKTFLKQIQSPQISTGLDLGKLSGASSKSITSGSSLFKQTFAAPLNLGFRSPSTTRTITKTETRPILKPSFYQDLGLSSKQEFKPVSIGGFKQSSVSRQQFKQAIIPIQGISEKQLTRQKTITNIPNIPGYNFNVGLPDLGLRGFGLPVGLDLFDYGRTRPAKKGKAVKGRYAPTITSLALNIKSSNIDKLYSKGAGAFSIRPIISTSKSSRRTKSSPRMARNRRKQRRDWWLR